LGRRYSETIFVVIILNKKRKVFDERKTHKKTDLKTDFVGKTAENFLSEKH